MGPSEEDGLKVIGLIGPGGCGSVCSAEDRGGNLVAVKFFEGLSIHRNLLATMTARLSAGGWPDGVMPILFVDFEGRPATLVMPLHADVDDQGELRPRSLQHRLRDHSGNAAWPLVRAIAGALAAMHAKRVAHGNLKPGNVFFDSSGRLMLTDWTLGNMPGVGHFEFTDALLYQPPEQLRDPGGYEQEAGYRWDVYSFGALAFRLLTGKFPRCDSTFSEVAPAEGDTRREGVHADLPKIARNLEANSAIEWPDGPEDRLTESWRAIIDQCLSLDPAHRPSTMNEVLTAFEGAEERIENEIEREALLDQRRRASHRAGRWCFTAGAVAALAVLLAGLWQLTVVRLSNEKQLRIDELAGLRTSTAEARAQKDEAVKIAGEAKRALEYERDISRARLEASRSVGDRLFSWAMEKGHRKLPPLDGREQRLKNLERYFVDFLNHTGEAPNLEAEKARVRLQLAEISLAAGDSEGAIKRLGEAIDAWKALPMDADLRFRLAQNRLLLALLLQSDSDPRVQTAFAEARKALGDVPQTEVDADRLQQAISILDFHEAKFLASKGDEPKALQQLMTATQTLNRLSAERPDSVVLRSELAACYLASATILEGMGSLGDAREVQGLAATEILKMLKQDPKDPGLRFDLAGCYGSMAEEAVLSGDIANADSMSAEAMKLLQGLVREQPDHVEAISLLASQIGLRAGLMRDRGESEAAVRSFDEAIRMLEAVRASAPDHSIASYRLALLWWQKGRMLGMAGKRTEEIELMRRSHDLLLKLEAARSPGGPTAEKIQTSTAYLLGDLGHSLQLSGKKPEAKEAFSESVSYWDRLLQSRPKSEEYQESMAWCRQRIKELQ